MLAELGPGAVFGEIALLDGGPRTADVAAVTNCTLLVFERRDFVPLLEHNWPLAEAVLKMVCERLRRADAYIADLAFSDLPGRLAKTLVARAHRGPGGAAVVDDTQGALAAMIGGSREAVNRCLRKWEKAGLIAMSAGRIVLADPEACARLAGEVKERDAAGIGRNAAFLLKQSTRVAGRRRCRQPWPRWRDSAAARVRTRVMASEAVFRVNRGSQRGGRSLPRPLPAQRSVKKASSFGQRRIASSIAGSLPGA